MPKTQTIPKHVIAWLLPATLTLVILHSLSAQAIFQRHYTPVDYYVSDNNSFTNAKVTKGADGKFYFYNRVVAVCDPASRQLTHAAALRCGGNPIYANARPVVFADGSFYGGGTAFGPDSVSCGASSTFGGGSYDAIAAAFAPDGTMRWGRALTNFSRQDAFSDLYALPDKSLVAVGNKFLTLRVAHFDAEGTILADTDLGIKVDAPRTALALDGNRLFTSDRGNLWLSYSPEGTSVKTGAIEANGFTIDATDEVGPLLALPDGTFAYGVTARIQQPFQRTLQVLKVDSAGRVLARYRNFKPETQREHYLRDLKLIDGKLYALGDHAPAGASDLTGLSLAVIDATTWAVELEESYYGARSAMGIEAIDARADTLIITASVPERRLRRGSFLKFSEQQLYGAIRLVRCQAEANFGFSSQGRVSTFQRFAGGESVDFTWDFGDGSNSTFENPSHTYASDGIYEVCLTARTANLCERTVCQTVRIPDGTSAATERALDKTAVKAYINDGRLSVQSLGPRLHQLELLDGFGRVLIRQDGLQASTYVSAGEVLPKGAYFLRIRLDGVSQPVTTVVIAR